MNLIVQKFGGTSTRSFETRKKMYEHIERQLNKGKKVIAVVSAMGRYGDPYATDTLLSNVRKESLTGEEIDRLMSMGETISSLVIKSELASKGINATTATFSEIGIHTNSIYQNADIEKVDGTILLNKLEEFDVIIVPGFQGISEEGKVTTLGRGGSDLSAVALAIGVGAKRVDIFSDVDGIYTADPRIVPDAKKIAYISYEEMLELACNGAKVLNHRCVQLAAKFGIEIHARSCFDFRRGTYVIGDDRMVQENLNEMLISGVTGSMNEARITLVGIDSTGNAPSKLFNAIDEAAINVNVFNQALVGGGKADISFIINDEDLPKATKICNDLKKELDAKRIIVRGNIGKVSIIGVGIKSHHGIFNQIFDTLESNDIHVEMTSCSEINISCYIDRDDVNKAQALIHELFIK